MVVRVRFLQALGNKRLSIVLSGSQPRRFPYYIGVVGKLTSLRVMTPETPVAGASAGSLIAACHHAGLTEKQVTEACWVLCDDCRRNGTRGRLGRVLERRASHGLGLSPGMQSCCICCAGCQTELHNCAR